MNAIGFLNIASNLLWKKTVLGKIYTININGIDYKIHFPRLSEKTTKDNYNLSLIAPKIVIEHNLNEDYVEFGNVIDSPNYDCFINYVVISGEVPSDKEIEELYSKIDEWVLSFLNIIKIIQNIIVHENKVDYVSDRLELVIKENDYKSPSNVNMPKITFYMNHQAVSNNTVNKAIRLLNNNVSIPEEYRYYLNAISNYEKRQYRNCILECATAAEMTVTDRLVENCKKNQITGYKSAIKNYKGLESSFDALVFFNDRPDIDISKITTPRNNAIHLGKKIEEAEAQECLKSTKRLLDKLKIFY